MSVFFNGRLLTTPAVASQIDDTAMANKNLTVPLNMAIVGRADSGEPQVVHRFSDPISAQTILQGGELLKAIEKAFSPSAQTYGPQEIFAIRVDPATQGRLVVDNGDSPETGAVQALGAEDPDFNVKLASEASAMDDNYNGYMIKMTSGAAKGETNLITGYIGATKIAALRYAWKNPPAVGDDYETAPASVCFESKDFGVNANRIKIKIQTGTTAGTKKFYSAYGSDQIIEDDISATYIIAEYTGEEASCLVEITKDEVIVSAGDIASEVELYRAALATYDTVEKLTDFLNSKPDIDAACESKYRDYPTQAALDYKAGFSISAGATAITANLQAIVDFINSNAEPYITAYRPMEAGEVPANFDWEFLAGGETGVATTTDWQDAINLLQGEDIQCLVPLTANAAVHAMGQAHCQFMSENGSMERRMIVGGALGETIVEVTARAYDLNDDRVYLVSPGYKDYDDDGELITFAPYMLAAIVGGMITGSDPGTSLTNKSLAIYGLEKKYVNPTDTDRLIKAGVIAIASTKTGYKIIQSVSTWLNNDNYNRVEMGTGFAVDYVARNVREGLEDLKGAKGTSTLLSRAVSITESKLKELSRPAPLGPEVIVGDEKNPAFKNITATLEGDVLRVYFQCSPVIPVNYVLVGISVVPYSGTATSY